MPCFQQACDTGAWAVTAFQEETEPQTHTNWPEMAGLGLRLRVWLSPVLLAAPWPHGSGHLVSGSAFSCLAVERCRVCCGGAALPRVPGCAAWCARGQLAGVCQAAPGGTALSAGGFPARGELRVGRSVE